MNAVDVPFSLFLKKLREAGVISVDNGALLTSIADDQGDSIRLVETDAEGLEFHYEFDECSVERVAYHSDDSTYYLTMSGEESTTSVELFDLKPFAAPGPEEILDAWAGEFAEIYEGREDLIELLDDKVHDMCAQLAVDSGNSSDEDMTAVEVRASEINNEGLAAQIRFLIRSDNEAGRTELKAELDSIAEKPQQRQPAGPFPAI